MKSETRAAKGAIGGDQNDEPMSSPRFPRHVFEAGAEPDPRFTLANERTFLAWIRTALAAMSHQLFDPGLQPERTELAWRRTTLALIVGALVALRLLPPALGSWSIIVGLAGLVLAAIIWVLAHRRARLTSHVLRHEHAVLPGGGLLLLLATVTTAGAALGLVYVTLH